MKDIATVYLPECALISRLAAKGGFIGILLEGIRRVHGNQFSKMFNSKMVILTSSETNNHSNNVDFVTKIIHLRSE